MSIESFPSDAARNTHDRKGTLSRIRSVSWKACVRPAVFVLGLAVLVTAFVLWLVPTSGESTTVSQQSTTVVTDHAGQKRTTAVGGTTTTTGPGAGRSDTVLVALLTFGFGLLLAAALWDRIQEVGIGGVSVKLNEAAVGVAKVALIDATATQLDSPTSTSFDDIAREIQTIAAAGLGVARVDLADGKLWARTNLCWYIFLLAGRTEAEVIVFTSEREWYAGAASVRRLVHWISAHEPALAAAHHATDGIPLDAKMRDQPSVGMRFEEELQKRAPETLASPQLVDVPLLEALAGTTLIAASVESDGESTLSRGRQRALLIYPLEYVPLTRDGRLVEIVDRLVLARRIALQAAGV